MALINKHKLSIQSWYNKHSVIESNKHHSQANKSVNRGKALKIILNDDKLIWRFIAQLDIDVS